MKVVIDTNVFVSGVFFSGPPYEILSAWRHGRFQIVLSTEILEEYTEVGRRLSAQYPEVSLSRILALVAIEAETIAAPPLNEPVCEDPTDDMFFACAVASGSEIIVSGDKHLHRAGGYQGIEVLTPRKFFERYLAQ